MFSGIISDIVQVRTCKRSDKGMRLWLSSRYDDLVLGESVAVNGVCLTVTDLDDAAFAVDLSSETLSCTHFSSVIEGQALNAERALRLQDRLSGHMVSGHVDQVVTLVDMVREGECCACRFSGVLPHHTGLLMPKGSLTLDGISLTINHVSETSFAVMVIPHTLEQTHLKYAKVGDVFNVEFDMLAKMIQRQLQHHKLEVSAHV